MLTTKQHDEIIRRTAIYKKAKREHAALSDVQLARKFCIGRMTLRRYSDPDFYGRSNVEDRILLEECIKERDRLAAIVEQHSPRALAKEMGRSVRHMREVIKDICR